MSITYTSGSIKSVRRVVKASSHCCPGVTSTVDAEFADGDQQHPLGWAIKDGEILRYHSIVCGQCQSLQVS